MEKFQIENNVLLRYSDTEENIIIPDGITEIASLAFENHKNIKNILIPDSVKRIGVETFSDCVHLKNIILK